MTTPLDRCLNCSFRHIYVLSFSLRVRNRCHREGRATNQWLVGKQMRERHRNNHEQPAAPQLLETELQVLRDYIDKGQIKVLILLLASTTGQTHQHMVRTFTIQM